MTTAPAEPAVPSLVEFDGFQPFRLLGTWNFVASDGTQLAITYNANGYEKIAYTQGSTITVRGAWAARPASASATWEVLFVPDSGQGTVPTTEASRGGAERCRGRAT